MNEQILIRLRQETTKLMPVIDYDKQTINEAIQAVYLAISNNTQLPSKGGFSDAQFNVIVNVVQSWVDAENAPEPTPEYMAERTRLKIALHRANLLTTINTAISQLNGETQIWWECAANFDMNDSRVQSMATALNISSQQLKDLWDLANTIE